MSGNFNTLNENFKKRYSGYSKEGKMDDIDRDLGDGCGWKQERGNVLRLQVTL